MTWVTRDAWLIIAARSIRSFAQAAIGVLLAAYLDLLGFGLGQIGLFITLGMAGSAFMSLAVVLFGEAVGRRRLMAAFTVLTGSTALLLTLTDQYVLLAFVAFVGAFNVAEGGPTGPIQPLERAAITDTVVPERRTDLFAFYSIVAIAARALGALAAGLPVVFERAGIGEIASYQVMFAGYAAIALVAGLLYASLSSSSEAATRTNRFTNPLTLPSRRIIFLMSGLFAIDSFGTRLVLQTLVAFWFLTKFGIDLAEVAVVFFSGNVLTALSITVAAKLANRFGLLNTIVLTHVPAVAVLFAIPFVPSAGWAVGLWLARAFFSQMDVPTKQSYSMAVVGSEERVAVGGVSQLGQSGLGLLAPSVATFLWSALWIGAPFLAAGIAKSAYLAGFYLIFRDVKPPEEATRPTPTQPAEAPR